ncbi:hypothetical protein A4R29_21265 [Mesorhizobium ciceri biovar biserrulae]|nr:hypothetical protein [Mesorhizobium ciceri]AMY01739.1 hypothetical protein A4R29_21265 [Mesorhizobium ciceri biovar biserrulae]
MPEGRSIFRTLTVRENLLLGGMIRKDKAEAAADLERVLEIFRSSGPATAALPATFPAASSSSLPSPAPSCSARR